MNQMRYEPWTPAGTFRREIDRLLQTPSRAAASQWVPAVDIREDENAFVVLMDMPGVEPSEIEIAVENGVLTLSGSRELDHSETADGYNRMERASGKFLRRFTMPDDIDPEAVTARSHNGVLEISLPKSPQTLPRRIEIAVN